MALGHAEPIPCLQCRAQFKFHIAYIGYINKAFDIRI